jgi:hypothetical protein
MNIVIGWPPNIEAIRAVFDLPEGVIITYGDTIYNPDNMHLGKELKAHEAVHVKQQTSYGVEEWWARYLIEKEFRFEQELEAHRVEWNTFLKKYKNRNKRAKFLNQIAHRLASPMYGYLVTPAEARKQIKMFWRNET